jgi:rod shape determining protein RodA
VSALRIDYKIEDLFDFKLFLPVLALIGIGLAAIYSSTVNHPTASGNFEKQVIFTIISIILFFTVYSIPTNFFRMAAVPAYLLSIFLLVIVLVAGKQVSGAKSWLDLGAFGFQPSEFAKLAAILAISAFLSRTNSNIENFKDIIYTLTIGFIPVGLILLEPDMGSSFVFFGLILCLLFWKGISLFGLFVVLSPAFIAVSSLFGMYYFLGGLSLVLLGLLFFRKDIFFSGSIFALNIAAGFFTDYVFKALSPHQQKRILSFMDPYADPLGAGYNAIQAKVAIGSGGLFGKGFLQGNQTQLQFIPEQWTDFIFCVIGEEFGFIGSVITIIFFIIIFYRIIKIAYSAKDEFLSLVSIGILAVYFIHWIINIGMSVGIMPVIGIPLPFVSYGGSSLLVNMIMLGIILNVFRTRKYYT